MKLKIVFRSPFDASLSISSNASRSRPFPSSPIAVISTKPTSKGCRTEFATSRLTRCSVPDLQAKTIEGSL